MKYVIVAHPVAGGEDISALFETEDFIPFARILKLAVWPKGEWEIDIAEYGKLGPLEET